MVTKERGALLQKFSLQFLDISKKRAPSGEGEVVHVTRMISNLINFRPHQPFEREIVERKFPWLFAMVEGRENKRWKNFSVLLRAKLNGKPHSFHRCRQLERRVLGCFVALRPPLVAVMQPHSWRIMHALSESITRWKSTAEHSRVLNYVLSTHSNAFDAASRTSYVCSH
jgi:hypothetical protein